MEPRARAAHIEPNNKENQRSKKQMGRYNKQISLSKV